MKSSCKRKNPHATIGTGIIYNVTIRIYIYEYNSYDKQHKNLTPLHQKHWKIYKVTFPIL